MLRNLLPYIVPSIPIGFGVGWLYRAGFYGWAFVATIIFVIAAFFTLVLLGRES